MIFAEITKRNYMSESVTLKSYFYEVLIPSSQKNTSSPIEDILHHVSKYIFYEKACALQMFQSTHPHGVRHRSDARIEGLRQVSIHAPTRGATTCVICSDIIKFSFNPRTHTGYDCKFKSKRSSYTGFNPRTHTGCDITLT